MEKIDNKIRAIVDDIDPNKQLLEVKVILPTQFNYIRIFFKRQAKWTSKFLLKLNSAEFLTKEMELIC